MLLAVAVVLAFTIIGNPSAPPVPVRTAVVTRGDVTATVTGSGNAASAVSTPVSFETDGTVTAVNVKAGDTVAVGQVLATVDPAASQEGLRTAQAALDGAKAAYEQAASGSTDVKKQQDRQALDTTSLATGVTNARTQLANDRATTATSDDRPHRRPRPLRRRRRPLRRRGPEADDRLTVVLLVALLVVGGFAGGPPVVVGTVRTVEADAIDVTDAGGAEVRVFVPRTAGTKGADGSVTATSVTVRAG